MKKRISVVLIFAILVTALSMSMTANAAKKKSSSSSVTLSKESLTLEIGKTAKLTAKGGKKYKWSSNNKAVATVSSKGVVKGVGRGNATITVKSGKAKATCSVEVKGPQVEFLEKSFYFNENTDSESEVPTDYNLNLYVVAPEGAALTWSSSDTSIFTVDNGVITPVKNGKAKVSAAIAGDPKSAAVAVVSISGMGYDDGKRVNITKKNFDQYFEPITFSSVAKYEERPILDNYDEETGKTTYTPGEWKTVRTEVHKYQGYVLKTPEKFQPGATSLNLTLLCNSADKKVSVDADNGTFTEISQVEDLGLVRKSIYGVTSVKCINEKDEEYDWDWYGGQKYITEKRTTVFSPNVRGKVVYLAADNVYESATATDNVAELNILSNPQVLYVHSGILYYK